MSIYLSSGCFLPSDLEMIIKFCLNHGFNLELSSSLPSSPATLDIVSNVKGKISFLIHNYFPSPQIPFVLNLASSDPSVHQKSVKLCQNAIDFCANLKVPFYSVHAGFALHLHPEDLGNPAKQNSLASKQLIPREQAYEKFVITIKDLALYASYKNVGLLVENNVVAQDNITDDGTFPLLLADVEEIKNFITDLSGFEVGLLLDVGHAKVSANTLKINPQTYFDELEPFIRCLHLSDNCGLQDNNSRFTMESWFIPNLAKLINIPMVIEVRKNSLAEIIEQHDILAKMHDWS